MKGLRYSRAVVSMLGMLYGAIACLAATYHVDQNHASASDANPGTAEQPWLTIQHAAETMGAGDTVLIHGGVYFEHVRTTQSGDTAAGDIVFSAFNDEVPIIDGTGSDYNNGFIVLHSYIKLLGLEVRNWNDNGIWSEGAAFLEISDCVVHDTTYGIGFSEGTHDFVCNRVETYNFDLYGFDVSPNGADCHHGVFNDCVAHSARDPQQNVDGFALGHGTQHDFLLNRCVAYSVADGFVASSRDSILQNCVAYDCWTTGYKLYQDDVSVINCLGYNGGTTNLELDWDGEPGTTTLMNCTFYNAGVFNIWVENLGDTLRMFNCIVAGGDNIGLCFEQYGAPNYQGDHNIFHNDQQDRAIYVGYEDEFTMSQIGSGAWTSYSGQDAHSLVVNDPNDLFVNPAAGDFHLLETSAAVDAGTSTDAPNDDLDGNSRPYGNGYDIGAYEYGGTQTTPQISRWLTHLTRPNGGFRTSVIFDNTSSMNATVTLWPFSMQGDGLPSRQIDVPGGGFLSMTQEALFPGQEVSHFGIEGDDEIVVVAGYRHATDSSAGTAHVTENALRETAYEVFPGEWGNIWDGMALVNLGDQAAVIEGIKVDANGNQTFRQTINSGLAAKAKQLLVFDSFFNHASAEKIIIVSSQPASILFLRGSGDSRYLFQTMPIMRHE